MHQHTAKVVIALCRTKQTERCLQRQWRMLCALGTRGEQARWLLR